MKCARVCAELNFPAGRAELIEQEGQLFSDNGPPSPWPACGYDQATCVRRTCASASRWAT